LIICKKYCTPQRCIKYTRIAGFIRLLAGYGAYIKELSVRLKIKIARFQFKKQLIKMGKDVFISYSKQDISTATMVCSKLETRGITCWIAPRDITPGVDFDEAILDGIDDSNSLLLILSSASNTSRFVQSEVNRAFSKGKSIFTFLIDDILPSRQLELYLARQQWLDGFSPPIEQKIDRLANAVLSLMGLADSNNILNQQQPLNNSISSLKVSSEKTQSVAKRFIDWLNRYDHHGESTTESFKTFIIADKCLVEYGVNYKEYLAIAEIIKKSDIKIDWIIPEETFTFLIAESKRNIEKYR
jgi:hypothetical protein